MTGPGCQDDAPTKTLCTCCRRPPPLHRGVEVCVPPHPSLPFLPSSPLFPSGGPTLPTSWGAWCRGVVHACSFLLLSSFSSPYQIVYIPPPHLFRPTRPSYCGGTQQKKWPKALYRHTSTHKQTDSLSLSLFHKSMHRCKISKDLYSSYAAAAAAAAAASLIRKECRLGNAPFPSLEHLHRPLLSPPAGG